jgi:hypothetical protein
MKYKLVVNITQNNMKGKFQIGFMGIITWGVSGMR